MKLIFRTVFLRESVGNAVLSDFHWQRTKTESWHFVAGAVRQMDFFSEWCLKNYVLVFACIFIRTTICNLFEAELALLVCRHMPFFAESLSKIMRFQLSCNENAVLAAVCV